MKLSTAMRIGSMTTRQIRYDWTDGNNGRCALGAIADACGLLSADLLSTIDKTVNMFPELREYFPPPHPKLLAPIGRLSEWITHLNDEAHWSRERIADWIEELENNGTIVHTESIEVSKPEEVLI